MFWRSLLVCWALLVVATGALTQSAPMRAMVHTATAASLGALGSAIGAAAEGQRLATLKGVGGGGVEVHAPVGGRIAGASRARAQLPAAVAWWTLAVLVPEALGAGAPGARGDLESPRQAVGHGLIGAVLLAVLMVSACLSTVPAAQLSSRAFARFYAVSSIALVLSAPWTLAPWHTGGGEDWHPATSVLGQLVRVGVFFTLHQGADRYTHWCLWYAGQNPWRPYVPLVHAAWMLVARESWWWLALPLATIQYAFYRKAAAVAQQQLLLPMSSSAAAPELDLEPPQTRGVGTFHEPATTVSVAQRRPVSGNTQATLQVAAAILDGRRPPAQPFRVAPLGERSLLAQLNLGKTAKYRA